MARPRNTRNAYGLWAMLPDDLLLVILMRLGFFEFFSFAGVCRSWRVVAATHQENFFEQRQEPFIVIISSYARRACSFLNIFDRRRYRTLLPDLTCKSVLGLSGGYMIMREIGHLWIINPLTRDEHPFPSISPYFPNACVPNFRGLLVYSPQLSDFLMIAVYRGNEHFIISRPQSSFWQMFKWALPNWAIADIAFFKGRIYVLTVTCIIKELSLYPYPSLKHLHVENNPTLVSSSLQLVATDDRLLIVDFKIGSQISVYEINFTTMEFVRTVNLGEEALFFSDIKCSSLVNPTKWGAQANCMYVLESSNRCSVFSMDGRRISSTQVVDAPTARLQPYMWYFPPLCSKPHILDDEQII